MYEHLASFADPNFYDFNEAEVGKTYYIWVSGEYNPDDPDCLLDLDNTEFGAYIILGRLFAHVDKGALMQDAFIIYDPKEFIESLKNGIVSKNAIFVDMFKIPSHRICDSVLWTSPLPRPQP